MTKESKLFDSNKNERNNINNSDYVFSALEDDNESLIIKNHAIDSAINGILISDLCGRIQYVNPAFVKMWGYSDKDELIGELMVKFWKLKGKTMSMIDTIIDCGYWDGKLVGEKKDGTEVHVKLSASLVRNEQQEPICILATFIDINDLIEALKKLESSKAAFHNIVEKSKDAVLITDEKGTIQFANKEANRMFYTNQEIDMQGGNFGIPISEEDFIEIDIYQNHGTKKGIGEMRVSDTEWDGKKAALVQIRDITEHKRTEDDLRDAKTKLKNTNEFLEKKVKERTQDIVKLLEKKDQFIGQLGHDLKTPLSILINIIPMIESEIKDEESKEDCKVAIRNVNYIKNLVKETLKIAELSSMNVKFDIKKHNLTTILNNSLKDFEMILHARGIQLEKQIKDDITLYIDELKIKEVIHNILNNSIKFTPEKGKITIKAKEDFDQTVTIIIEDTGQGMSKEQLNHVFDEFYKTDPSRHDLAGSGLGLTISKRIIEKHGGVIWAESEGIGKGSSFYIRLNKKYKGK